MSRASIGLYEFGPFRLNLERRLFTREHQVVPLAPKTFDLLVLLVQSPGRAFSKQELMNALWPDTFVEEANLSFQISVLRKALGEDGAGWVETVPKHGYRFGADVRATMPSDKSLAEPVSSAKNEPSSVMPKRGTKKVWLAGATVTAALLVVVTFLTVVREPRTGGGQDFARPRRSAHCVSGRRAGAEPLARRKPGRLFLERPDAGQLRHLRQTGRARGTRALDDEPRARRLTCVVARWPFHRIHPIHVAQHGCGPGRDPSAWRRRKDHCDDFPGAHSPERQADRQSLLDAGRKMACLRWRDITQRPARHLVDRSRWLGAAAPHRSSGRVHDMSPVVSPDGRYLAFLRVRTVGRVAIFLVPLTSGPAPSGTPRQLTDDDYGVIGLAWTPDGRDLVFSAGGHLGLSRTARISAVPQSSRTPGPEFLPFGEQATGISIAGTGRLVYSAQFRDTALYELALSGPPAQSGRARRLLLDLRRTDASLFAGRETAGIRVDTVRSGGDLDCQQGRFESAAGDVHGRTAVLESPVVAGRADDSLQLATSGLGRSLSASAGHRQTHSTDRRSGATRGKPDGRVTANGSISGRTGPAGTRCGVCRRREVRRLR